MARRTGSPVKPLDKVTMSAFTATVNDTAALVPALVVIVTLYLSGATEGTTAWIRVSLHEETAAGVEPNFTVLVPWLAPKLIPAIVTTLPAVPAGEDKESMWG